MKIERTNYYYDVNKLKIEVFKFKKYFNEINQLNVKYDRTRNIETLPHLNCIGKSPKDISEWNFDNVSPIFENSHMLSTVSQIKETTHRIRLMAMKPKSCYSLHIDTYKRLHWAIITHPSCHMSFQESDEKVFSGFHIPADGYGYMVDTRMMHTALNPWDQFRYHLVIDIIDS